MRNVRVFTGALLASLPLFACECDDGGDIQRLLPNLRVEPAMLDFGEVPLGRDRTATIRLTNDGEATLSLGAVTLETATDEFDLLDRAPTTLSANQSVELSVKYTAIMLGETTATLSISSDDEDGATTVAIRGIGVVPGVDVTTNGPGCGDTPGSLSFGTIAPGQSSEREITVIATGSAPVTISGAVISQGASGEWWLEAVPEEGVELRQGESLVLTARYSPSDPGPDSAAFILTTNVPGRMNIRIPACGVGASPALCATPVPLDLGVTGIGVATEGTIHLENCSADALDVTAVSITADAAHPSSPGFGAAPNVRLPVTLQAGEGLDVTVSFASAILGGSAGYLQAATTAPTQPEAFFPILATVRDTCQVLLAPDRLVFNNVVVGASDRRNVLVANNGADDCAIRRAEITTGSNVYSVSAAPSTPFNLVSGGAETISVRYEPRSGGVMHSGILEVEAGATIHRVELLGNPPAVAGCQLEVIPGFINFGPVPRNQSVLRGVDVRNVSEEICNLANVELDPSSSPQFTNVQFQAGPIAPGQRTTIVVNYRAPDSGVVSGTLHVTSDDVDSPVIDVPVLGTSAPPNVCVEPLNLDFGSITNGTLDFRIHACGPSAVTVTDLAFTRQDPEFSLRNPPQLPLVLQPGEVQTVTVLYEGLDGVGDSAIVTVGTDDLVSPTVEVGVTAGPVIVPPSAGRYLYYWQINTFTSGESNIFRIPLQGQPTAEAYWGPLAGKPCTGCHGVSPDGRYVAVIEATNFSLTVIDTTTDIQVVLPFTVSNTAFFTWKPDVNSNPPYQFAYDENEVVHVASIVAGYIGELQGANDLGYGSKMPSWGPNGQIAFARGQRGGGWGFFGPSDIMLVDEAGGQPVALAGASANGGANYYPAYHPNGDWVAFNYSASATGTLSNQFDGQIKMVPTNQTGVVFDLPQLNCPPGQCSSSFPTWSMDGAYLSFSSNRPGGQGNWDLYLGPIDPVTGADQPATNILEANTPDFQHAARWSD